MFKLNKSHKPTFSAVFETVKAITPSEFLDQYSELIEDDIYSLVTDIGFEVVEIGEINDSIVYIQTTLQYDDTPNLDTCSGCGGRSYVNITSDSIDTWNTPEEAIENGKSSFRDGSAWGVYALDMATRRILKCCYTNTRDK